RNERETGRAAGSRGLSSDGAGTQRQQAETEGEIMAKVAFSR
ncbi:hypothetical protein PvtlMGM1_0780, partial [Prevotella sp. MGM1]